VVAHQALFQSASESGKTSQQILRQILRCWIRATIASQGRIRVADRGPCSAGPGPGARQRKAARRDGVGCLGPGMAGTGPRDNGVVGSEPAGGGRYSPFIGSTIAWKTRGRQARANPVDPGALAANNLKSRGCCEVVMRLMPWSCRGHVTPRTGLAGKAWSLELEGGEPNFT
jgi:hypothetical protein